MRGYINQDDSAMSEADIAIELSRQEGREVSIYEVRCIVYRALRKLRLALLIRGISWYDDVA